MPGIYNERAVWLANNVLPHEPALRAWLGQRRVLRLEIDDVVQETYAVLAGLPSVEHIKNPKSYTYAVAQSLILRQIRRSRIVSIEAMGEIDRLGLLGDEVSPERQAADSQELSRLSQAISGLPEKCRLAFTLRKVDGLSQRQVAERMGVSEGTIEKHIGKALRILMDAFGRAEKPAGETVARPEMEGVAHGKVRDRRRD